MIAVAVALRELRAHRVRLRGNPTKRGLFPGICRYLNAVERQATLGDGVSLELTDAELLMATAHYHRNDDTLTAAMAVATCRLNVGRIS